MSAEQQFQVPIEGLKESVVEFIRGELGDAWEQLPEEQKQLALRVATNYGLEYSKKVLAKIFDDINEDEIERNIDHLKAQLKVLGVILQEQVIAVLNKAIEKALREVLLSIASGSGSNESEAETQ